MITLMVGNLGSSKTTNAVRTMVKDNSGLPTFTNIKTKNIPNVKFKENKTILHEETITVGKKEKKKFSFNRQYWLSLPKPMNIIWDEIHFMADSRESQSQMNKAITEFVSMARRIIGMDEYGYGDFIFIAQRMGTIDVRIRELVTNIIYHILNWDFSCDTCGCRFKWNSEKANIKFCPRCRKRTLRKSNYITERYHFKDSEKMFAWFQMGLKTYSKRDLITDIGDYFEYFDTLQYLKAESTGGRHGKRSDI